MLESDDLCSYMYLTILPVTQEENIHRDLDSYYFIVYSYIDGFGCIKVVFPNKFSYVFARSEYTRYKQV